ncbi:MAG: ABC-2 type transport system ATP-binding protein [Candidatus Kentron sp. G]|nr:MAG: ABC-2 type transport system ATP-binding protein [Candidatus Kentron sp. G]VFM96829.1 MAG: ABC-2 type transport system ATP-binding protein [Candidatus Kentron sp. G]VFM97020.1 MAG: ABC-2 type transport system ATP-binding protein [Candidatus Kentron sp. G]
MIEAQNLTRRYDDFTAVDNVSFHIDQGEVVGLLGHNGAGKTTIMKMMTGFLEPTSGTIGMGDLEIGPETRKIQSLIGYLPENCPLWPEMTVIDYLEFQATLHGIRAGDQAQAIREAIARTALTEKATHSIQTLSRGYRQRVGVAQAILHHPKVVILDEPTNGLDPTQIQQMRGLIRELARTATIIVSTHILQEVQAVCERVLILRAGRLVVDSRLDALQEEQHLLVSTDHGDPALFDAIETVTDVQKRENRGAGPHTFVLTAPLDAAPRVALAVTTSGAKLYALQPESRDLETVFAEVNTIDTEDTEREAI